jgi:hypothetical protein
VGGHTAVWGSHLPEERDSGIIAVLFGAGSGVSTDGVGAPPTDCYWRITRAQR